MTEEQLSMLNKVELISNLVTIDDLYDKSDRTLLYGYDCERITYHTYIKDGEICNVFYGGYMNAPLTPYVAVTSEDYIPDKRLYPECCDYEFCSILTSRKIYLPFTTYDSKRDKKKYYGEVI